MYRWLRNTHLFLGLFSCLFVLMYGISSVAMVHTSWFPRRPAISESRITVSAEAASSARALARELMDRHGIRGELVGAQTTPDGFRFRISRPGLHHFVTYSNGSAEARVEKRVVGVIHTLSDIHHVSGLESEDWLANVWGFFIGIVSVGLIVLALTGIYLWFKIHTERLTGSILLAISLGYSLTVMLLLRTA